MGRQRRHIRHSKRGSKYILNEYEIRLESDNLEDEMEYGFGTNPPVVVHARNETQARNMIKIPRNKNVRIVSINRVG
jgi:hypothetical protein